VLIATGEDLPPGTSILGRIVAIECERERIDLAALTRSQERRSLLAHALRGFVEWLAPQYEAIGAEMRGLHAEYAREMRGVGAHARTPDALAYLRLGIELLARYARAAGALDAEGADRLRADAMRALCTIGKRSAQALEESRPAEQYISALRSMLVSERVRIQPVEPTAETGEDVIDFDFERGDRIGWCYGEYAYLDPNETYRRVFTFYRGSGQVFSISRREVHKALAKAGYIALSTESGERRYEIKPPRCIPGRQRMLRVPLRVLDGANESDAQA
jgi:hypothetical protein